MHGLTSRSVLSGRFVDKQKVGGCGLNKGHIWPKGSTLDLSVLVPQKSFAEILD